MARTPLAALWPQVDLARTAPDAAARTEALDELHAPASTAPPTLVEQLLTMRTEPEALTRAFDAIDLVALVKDAIVARCAAADQRIDLG
jgi:hypothetical protein